MSALQTVRETKGLADYLNAVERRLADVVHAHPGVVASVGSDALSAGGKRLRPTLTFLSAAPDADAPVVEGAAVELVHMATLVHDDIVDGAHLRRGRASAWTAHGADAAKAAGDHLFAAAFATLAAEGIPPDADWKIISASGSTGGETASAQVRLVCSGEPGFSASWDDVYVAKP